MSHHHAMTSLVVNNIELIKYFLEEPCLLILTVESGTVQVLRDQGWGRGGKGKDNTLITCPGREGGGGR